MFGNQAVESPTYDQPMMIPQRRTVNPLSLDALSDESANDPLASLMNFEPETRANEEFTNLLHSFPTREKPRFITRLMTALSQNPALAEKAQYKDFYRNLEDWKNKIVPFQQAADNETNQNVNRRLIAGNIATARYKQDDLSRKITEGEQRNTATLRRLDIAEYANTIKAQVAKGGVITPDIDGSLHMVYKDGTKIPLDMSKITPEMLEDIKHTNRLSEIDARGDESRATGAANARGNIYQSKDVDGNPGPVFSINPVDNTVEIVDDATLAGMNLTPISRPPGTGNQPKPQSASDRQKEVVNNANQVKAAHPEWSEFITVGRNGVVISKPGVKGKFSFGKKPDQKTYDSIYNAIYGKSSVKDTSIAPIAPAGWKYVPKAGGGWTAVEDKK
jgi:hypothetical protein